MVQLWAVDASGAEVGLNPTTGLVRLGIAGASYSGRGVYPQLLTIPNAGGTYDVYVKLLTGGSYKVTFDLSGGSASGLAEKVQQGRLPIGGTAELAVAVGRDPEGKPLLDVSLLTPANSEDAGHPPALAPKGPPTGPLVPEPWWAPFPAAIKPQIPRVVMPRIGPAIPRSGSLTVAAPPSTAASPIGQANVSPPPDHAPGQAATTAPAASATAAATSSAPSTPSGSPPPRASGQDSAPSSAAQAAAPPSPASQPASAQPASSSPAPASPTTPSGSAGTAPSASGSSKPSTTSAAPSPALALHAGPVQAAVSISPTSGISLKGL
jgi:hypothetical protein